MYFYCYPVIYIPARGVLIPIYCIIPGIMEDRAHWGIKLLLVLLGVQATVFGKMMWGIMRKNSKKRREMREKGVEFGWLSTEEE